MKQQNSMGGQQKLGKSQKLSIASNTPSGKGMISGNGQGGNMNSHRVNAQNQ